MLHPSYQTIRNQKKNLKNQLHLQEFIRQSFTADASITQKK